MPRTSDLTSAEIDQSENAPAQGSPRQMSVTTTQPTHHGSKKEIGQACTRRHEIKSGKDEAICEGLDDYVETVIQIST